MTTLEIITIVFICVVAFVFIADFIIWLFQGRRELYLEYQLSCVLEALEKIMNDRIFPEFKNSNHDGENGNENV